MVTARRSSARPSRRTGSRRPAAQALRSPNRSARLRLQSRGAVGDCRCVIRRKRYASNVAQALGPWFHNMDLAGVKTAPDHFLGDYPAVKWAVRPCAPADLRGKTVLDIGCNGGFYAIQMKRRGADRVLGIDIDDEYLAQARFAAEVAVSTSSFEQLSVYDVGRAGRALRPRALHGRPLSPAPSAARARSHPRARRARPLSSSRCSAAAKASSAAARRTTISGTPTLRTAGFSEAALHRAALCRRSDQLVDPESRLLPRRCCAAPVSTISRPPRRRSSSADGGESPARRAGQSIRRQESGHDRSGHDLERAEQQIALGSEVDPDWHSFREMATARPTRSPRRPAGLPHVLGGISPIDPAFIANMQGQGVLDHLDAVAVHGFPLDWNLGRSTNGPQARRDPDGDGSADLGLRGRRLDLRRRGGAGLGPAPHRRTARRPSAAHPLVQPLRPAARLAGDDAAPRGRGLLLLPAFRTWACCARTARPSPR